MASLINSKREFFELPDLKRDPLETDTLEAQVFYCTHGARTPNECKFFKSFPHKQKPGTKRPKCPDHPKEATSWANIYEVDGKLRRYHW